jgi:hypothetical protein
MAQRTRGQIANGRGLVVGGDDDGVFIHAVLKLNAKTPRREENQDSR